MAEPTEVAVARLLGPHGLGGEIEAKVLTDRPDRLVPGSTFHVSSHPLGVAEITIQGVRSKKHVLLLRLLGVDDRNAAEAFRGALLTMATRNLPPLQQGSYYHHELLGMRVCTTGGRDLGRIEEIIETGANDVYVVRDGESEALIPAIRSVVVDVDKAGGLMSIDPLPGLLDGDEDED